MHNKHLGVNIVSVTYIESKIDNVSYCKTNGQFTRHLRNHKLTYKEYFEKYVTGYSPLCNCGKPLTFYQKTESYANSCGDVKCIGNSVSKTKSNWTTEQKHKDSENKKLAAKEKTAEQLQIQYQKAKSTFRKKYGVDWGSKLASQKEKSRTTKFLKYGDKKYNNRSAISRVNLEKSVEEKNIINEKRRKTNLDRYGVECVMILPESKTKSAISNSIGRDFVMPSGKIVGVRGYENTVLIKLLEDYDEQELLFHNTRGEEYTLPIFEYVNVNQHTAKYYPDIFIPKENKIIEVKSQWWWNGNGDAKYASRLENNLRKRTAVLDAGYNYEVWLFEDKTNYKILNDTDI